MATKRDKPKELSVRSASRAEWRRWLAKRHTRVQSVILVYARKDSGERSIAYDESVEEALCFGWVDGVRGKLDEQHYTVRFTPRKPTSIWSKLNIERVNRLTSAGLMQPTGLLAFEVGKRSGRHQTAYAVRDRVEMPRELLLALAKNRRGKAAFEALPLGQKKGWMRWIAWSKREVTRRERARVALLLILAGRKAGETDAQAARRGVPSKAEILGG
jgi:uncharacterized protein YdeI (YjbR/CyaY-like superfamily)